MTLKENKVGGNDDSQSGIIKCKPSISGARKILPEHVLNSRGKEEHPEMQKKGLSVNLALLFLLYSYFIARVTHCVESSDYVVLTSKVEGRGTER